MQKADWEKFREIQRRFYQGGNLSKDEIDWLIKVIDAKL